MTIDIAEYHEELFQEIHSLADAEGRFAEDAFFDVLTASLIDAGEIETGGPGSSRFPSGHSS